MGFDPVETEMTFNRNEYEDIFTAAAAYADELYGDGQDLFYDRSKRISGFRGRFFVEVDFQYGRVGTVARDYRSSDQMRVTLLPDEQATKAEVAEMLLSPEFEAFVAAWDSREQDAINASVLNMESGILLAA